MAVQIKASKPIQTLALSGYPSRANGTKQGADFIRCPTPSKTKNKAISPLRTRPVQSIPFDPFANCVLDCTDSISRIRYLSQAPQSSNRLAAAFHNVRHRREKAASHRSSDTLAVHTTQSGCLAHSLPSCEYGDHHALSQSRLRRLRD